MAAVLFDISQKTVYAIEKISQARYTTMKKLLSIGVCLILLLAMAVNAIGVAAATPTVALPDLTGKPGDTVAVTVRLKNNPGLISAKVKVGYDATALEFVEVQKGDFPENGYSMGDPAKNPFTVNFCNGIAPIDYTIELLGTVHLRIKEDAKPGTYPLTLTCDFDGDFFNRAWDTVSFALDEGSVTVAGNAADGTTQKPNGTTQKPAGSTAASGTAASGSATNGTTVAGSTASGSTATTVVGTPSSAASNGSATNGSAGSIGGTDAVTPTTSAVGGTTQQSGAPNPNDTTTAQNGDAPADTAASATATDGTVTPPTDTIVGDSDTTTMANGETVTTTTAADDTASSDQKAEDTATDEEGNAKKAPLTLWLVIIPIAAVIIIVITIHLVTKMRKNQNP